jgi:hypothetical protein
VSYFQIRDLKQSVISNKIYFIIQKFWTQHASSYYVKMNMKNQIVDLGFTQWPSFVGNNPTLQMILWHKQTNTLTISSMLVATTLGIKPKKGGILMWKCKLCINSINKTRNPTISSSSMSIAFIDSYCFHKSNNQIQWKKTQSKWCRKFECKKLLQKVHAKSWTKICKIECI